MVSLFVMQENQARHLKIGCCGFPRSRVQYFKEFSAVEVQQTFYQLPKPETAKKWRQEAPGGFEFTLKAWQLITHRPTSPTYRKLRENIPDQKRSYYGFFQPTPEVFEAWRRTLEIVHILKTKVVIFQCPASFIPTNTNKENMRKFFRAINRGKLIFCWEPRGDWPPNEIRELCEELNLVHCVDPFVQESVYGSIRYYRLHGIGGYRYRYTEIDLKNLSQKSFEQGITLTYIMFNNVFMWEDAHRFIKILEGKN